MATPNFKVPSGRPFGTAEDALEVVDPGGIWRFKPKTAAGYCGYKTTGEMRAHLKVGGRLEKFLCKFLDLYNRNYDMTRPNKNITTSRNHIKVSKLMNMAWNWSYLPTEVLTEIQLDCYTAVKDGPSTEIDQLGENSSLRHYYCTLAAMRMVIDECPNLGKEPPPAERIALFGFHIEDWSKAHTIVSHYTNRLNKKASNFEDNGSTQNRASEMPAMKSDSVN